MSHGNEPGGQPSQSMPTPLMLEEKVDMLATCMGLITQAIIDQQTGPPTAAAVCCPVVDEDEEMGDFGDKAEEGEQVGSGVTESGKVCLPKYAPPQLFNGTWDDTKLFISSMVLYISGQHPEFCTAKSKIMFALLYIKGGKAQFWRNGAINKIVAGHKPFKNFHDFLAKLEAQFSDPNPDATAKGKLKVMRQGAKMADEFILEFKSEASHSNLGDVALIEYLKAGLNQSLFKSIY
jgi:Retrotransposon gag protein